MKIDDDVKQELLDSLAKEPTMVVSTAYIYAKTYVEYGEDITKAWTTAVQQASILERVRVEAYNNFKDNYENRIAKAIDKVEEYICDVETDTVKAQGMAKALDIFEKTLREGE